MVQMKMEVEAALARASAESEARTLAEESAAADVRKAERLAASSEASKVAATTPRP